ncbi:hypothetical protein [Microvirga puerhi]|uniref:DUF748 domain-containing protein n=1 Tax=Microvirga puerhi TaxID=2876078 RepID=A0ABS7VI59_9HYPH|nr:hypothetical protein [Microvirga puerhi]MBZ6074775.1 hypothetical protein [Microvirga puerhi]
MGFVYRSSIGALALAAGAIGLQMEPAVLRNLVAATPTSQVSVEAVRAPLWSLAFAQSPATFSLDNVRMTFGSASYEAKTIRFDGVTTSRAEIEALFAAQTSDPWAARLSRINAAQVTIPELKVEQIFGSKTQVTTYRDLALTNIRAGHIAEAVAATAGAEVSDGKRRTTVSYGRMAISDVDGPGIANLFEAKAENPAAPLTRLYGSFSIDDVNFVDDQNGTNVAIPHMVGRDFMARPTADSWSGSMSVFTELADRRDLSEDEQKRLLTTFADVFGAFGIGFMEARDMTVKFRPDEAKGQDTASIRRMAYTGAKGTQPADARVEGVDIRTEDGRMAIGTIAFTGFSFASTIEGLKTLGDKRLKELDATTLRGLMPKLGTMTVEGIDIDMPNAKPNADAPDRVKASLKSFEVTADQPVSAIPTNLRVSIRNFAMAVPENSKDEGIQSLTSLGYKAVDMSMLVAAGWNAGTQELNLKEVSVEGKDMGRISLTGLLGDVSQDVFNPDTALATVALIGARAKTLNLVVENGGLFERYLNKTAKEQKTTPESLRRTFAAGTAVVIPSMLGSSGGAKTLSQAIARFIAKPGRLVVNAKAKDPAGLGVADLITAADPSAVIEKLDISATAE